MQQPQQPGKILRWVNASERTPSDPGTYHTNLGLTEWGNSGINGDDVYYWLNRHGGHVTEWLEQLEDLSAPASPVEEKPQEFEEWVKHRIREMRGLNMSEDDKIKRVARATYEKVAKSKPSPVIETKTGSLDEWSRKHNEWCKHYGLGAYQKKDGEQAADSFLVWLDEQSKEQEALMDKENQKMEPYGAYYGAWNMLDQAKEKYLSLKTSPPPVIEMGEQTPFWTDVLAKEYAEVYRFSSSRITIEQFKASHPAPAPIVGERTDKPLEGEMLGVLNKTSDRLFERKYPIGGYAPGNYTCKCVTCGDTFGGDKRAVQCEPCALKAASPAPAPMDQDHDNIVWKIIERFQQERSENSDCYDNVTWSDRVLSYNDVEVVLYEFLGSKTKPEDQGAAERERAIAFAEWIQKEDIQLDSDGWVIMETQWEKAHSSAELFDLFLQSQNK